MVSVLQRGAVVAAALAVSCRCAPKATDSGGPGADSGDAAKGTDSAPDTDAVPGTDAVPPGTDAVAPGTDATVATDAAPPGTDAVAPPGTDAAPGACTGTPFGPDAFGYTGCAFSPAAAPCDDITLTGTDAALLDDDFTSVPIGFSFEYYGTAASTVTISSNGALTFTGAYLGLPNACIPGPNAMSVPQFIAAFWDDLDPTAGGGAVRYELFGSPPDRRFVVQWNAAGYGPTSGLGDVRAVLYEGTNAIDVCYVDTAFLDAAYNFGSGATAGLQESDSAGLPYSCDMPLLLGGLVLHYTHP